MEGRGGGSEKFYAERLLPDVPRLTTSYNYFQPIIVFKRILACDQAPDRRLREFLKSYYKVRQLAITKCDSVYFYKVREIVITKCDSYFITKCDKCYYKVRQVLQSVTILLQSATGITKCVDYNKVRQNTLSNLHMHQLVINTMGIMQMTV